MTDRELMQMALEALEAMQNYAAAENKGLRICDQAIEALRARLAQEPLTFEASNVTGIYTTQPYVAQAAMVASQTQGRMSIDPVTGDVGIGNPNQVTLDTSGATTFSITPIDWDASAPLVVTPHPAFKKPWVGLTDEEIGSVIEASQITLKNYCSEDKQTEYARAIEAKLKEKNSG